MDDSPVEEYRNKMTDWGLPLSQYSQQCQACFAPQSGSGLDIVENTEQGRQANQYRYPRPERRYSVFRNRGTVAPEYSDYFTTLMEDRLWQVLAKPVFRWRNRSGLSMNADRAA